MIVTAVIRYGGCEVVAPWTLLFGRHYVLYCPFNAVDLVERPFHRLPMNLAVGVAAAITAVVGIYFVLGRDVLERLDLSEPIAPRWALLLLVPAGLLAYQAVRTHRDDARVLLFGVAVLVLLALYFAELIPVQGLWELVMLVGLLYATGRMVISILRRRQTR